MQGYAKAYEQFFQEYQSKAADEISSIQTGALRLYAVEQSAKVRDWGGIFEQLEYAFPTLRTICEKPKSHLKAVNEVRPIETVKRIGYESISYLAAHSGDWLAKTAGGLKPARLFARVEEEEFQIYENRVVKTLIDLIIGFLRRTEKQLRDQGGQLRSVMDGGVQTGSFGFDVGFQKAVSELMSSDQNGDEYRSKSLKLTEELQARAYRLLKKYRTLRQTRLYRYLKKTRPVPSPLNETNILVLDKHYGVVFRLWKAVHHDVVSPKSSESEVEIASGDTYGHYLLFCAVLCGYAAHVLNFKWLEDGRYQRNADHIEIKIEKNDKFINVLISDKERHSAQIPPEIEVPVKPGGAYPDAGGFCYEDRLLSWPNDVSDDLIDKFCGLFKTRESRGREQSEEKRKYNALKGLIIERQRSYPKPGKSSFQILPIVMEHGMENRYSIREALDQAAARAWEDYPGEELVMALPLCGENEQRLTEYAKGQAQALSVLPLTMFDINSFRRIQNILYRHILKLKKGGCLNCGGAVRTHDNQGVCDACNGLTLTKTICPNPQCRHEYFYLSYDVSRETVHKMQTVKQEDFFQWDSLYQYKNIVNMKLDEGKIRTVCPCCHQG